jgi:hypothetical protein
MTAHDGLGSVRADRRKDLESPTPARSTPTVDVAEGRRLLAAYRSLDAVSPTYSDLHRWLFDYAPALRDAAEEAERAATRHDMLREVLVVRERVLKERIDAARAELTALKEGISEAIEDDGVDPERPVHPERVAGWRACADEVRALLNGADQ